MKPLRVIVVSIMLFAGNFPLLAQLLVTNGSATGLSPTQLVQQWLIGTNVTISNVTINGSALEINNDQLGTFTAADSAAWLLGIEGGILMTSGIATHAMGVNDVCGKTGDTGGDGDSDLDQLAGVPRSTHDASVIEFDFYPSYDTIKFNYVFSSEEFYTFCNTQYNDRFGFFLSGPGIMGPFSNGAVNIAYMSGTTQYVGINTLCDDPLSNWCNAPATCIRTNPNPPCRSCENCTEPRGHGRQMQYNGFSYLLTAFYIVQPCQLYHIKLAIADAGDHILDSGVFLEKNSFTSSGMQVYSTFSIPSITQGAVEGCNDAIIHFKLLTPTPVPYTIQFIIGGDAINGVDYSPVGSSVVVPAESDSASIVIHPLFDGMTEGVELFTIDALMPGCFQLFNLYDTVQIWDNTLLEVSAGNDTIICIGDSLAINAMPAGGLAPYQYTWSNGSKLSQISVLPLPGLNLYWVTVSDPCGASETDTISVMAVDPPQIITTPLNYSVCSGTATNILLQSTIPGSSFTWTAVSSSPTVTGFSNDSGTIISQTLYNSGFSHDTVLYTLHANYNNCIGPDTSLYVIVIPIPDASVQPPADTICSEETTNIAIQSSFPTATFSWTFTQLSGNITGASNGTGSLLAQTLFNNGLTSDSVIFHIQPWDSGCAGTDFNVPITVRPLPSITNMILNDTICTNTSTNITLVSSTSPSTFHWDVICHSPNITGYYADSGTVIMQTLFNSGYLLDTVIYQVHAVADGCTGPVREFNILVSPIANVIFTPPSQTICSGDQTDILLGSSVNGSEFSWTASGSSPAVTGYSPGSGNQIQQMLTNLGSLPETVTYNVFPNFVGCQGISDSLFVVVYLYPDVTFTPCFDTITTTNAKPFKLKGGIPLGGTYSGSGTGWTSETGWTFYPAIAGPGIHQITYSYTNIALCTDARYVIIDTRSASPFSCGNDLLDSRDSSVYPTVQIGSQCWFASNLNYGTEIPYTSPQRDNCIPEKYKSAVGSLQLAVYQWDEIMGYQDVEELQGLCPPGWHVPSEADWNQLFAYYQGNAFAGSPLIYSGYSGFDAQLAGITAFNLSWHFDGFATLFWSSTSHGPWKAWAHGMNEYNYSVSFYPGFRANAFGVRCLKD
ncbi:MAG: choice-of-anchor L domain-containing protein [Bacteroidales bacterium]|nr:choice-of-anchor L domain-containing protein [Bacteroidales bacterium]